MKKAAGLMRVTNNNKFERISLALPQFWSEKSKLLCVKEPTLFFFFFTTDDAYWKPCHFKYSKKRE